jgi:hypothetical protein
VDELFGVPFFLWGHPGPLSVTGEEVSIIPNICSIVKPCPAISVGGCPTAHRSSGDRSVVTTSSGAGLVDIDP